MMPIESLSSFAISVAANIVSSLFARNCTEKDIREAFQEAIEKWCPNEDIRRFREADIASFVRGYIQNPSFDEEDLSGEMKDFLRCFEESVASHPAAFQYLSAIKGKVYYNEVMTALQIVNTKLDAISRKIDEADPRHSDLHFEAVSQINTVLETSVVDYVNVFLYGILAAFDDDIYAYIDSVSDQKIPVVIDRDSLLKEVDGDYIRPKFQDIDYDWDKEEKHDWCQLNPNLGFGELFSRSYIAGFQMMGIDLFESIEALNETIDRKTINDQLSKEEKRLLTEIEVSLRAVQSMLDDHSDIICKLDGCSLRI